MSMRITITQSPYRQNFTVTASKRIAGNIEKMKVFFISAFLVLLSATSFGQLAPQPPTRNFISPFTTKFNIDGYLRQQTSGVGDWLSANGSTPADQFVLTDALVATKPLVYTENDSYGSDDLIFDGSNRA